MSLVRVKFTVATLVLLILGSLLITLGENFLRQANGANGPDFGMASSTSSLTITLGSSGAVTITLTSLNGFSGSVGLSNEISPPGPTSSLTPQTVILGSGEAQTSSLTVSTIGASPFNSVGSYTINATGTSNSPSGTIVHFVIIVLTVSSASSGLGGLLSLIALAILAVVVVLIVHFARRKSVKK